MVAMIRVLLQVQRRSHSGPSLPTWGQRLPGLHLGDATADDRRREPGRGAYFSDPAVAEQSGYNRGPEATATLAEILHETLMIGPEPFHNGLRSQGERIP